MDSQPSERKALVFSAGDVKLALRLSQVREILPSPGEGGEVLWRGEPVPAVPVAIALGLPAPRAAFALLTEGDPMRALRIEALHGIVDLSQVQVFQLPTRTLLPQPPPFQSAMVLRDEIVLELAPATLGWAPLEPAADPVSELPPNVAAATERELLFARAGKSFAVPLPLLVQVLEAPRIWRVPLAAPSHRGLLYHGRSIHPIFDIAPLLGVDPAEQAGAPAPRTAILIDAGGAAVGVLADRVLGVGEVGPGGEVVRPAWDAVFA